MRILVLTPWLLTEPINGGQLRAQAIVDAYRAASHEVISCGLYLFGDNASKQSMPTDIGVDPEWLQRPELQRLLNDSEMSSWQMLASTPEVVETFAATIETVRPDIIEFEEIVLWPILKRVMRSLARPNIKLIHSSYNFETEAWKHRSSTGSPSHRTMNDIAIFEREIAQLCDGVITVSESDADAFRSLSARRVVVAPNGVKSLLMQRPPVALDYLHADPYALYVSSAHPPNVKGFVDVAIGYRGSALEAGELFICGRVGDLIRSSSRRLEAAYVIERSRFLGWVSDQILPSLYASSRVIILPKVYSGGSSLKTAEALISNRPIVATRLAFEGFENFRHLPGIHLIDDFGEFWSQVDQHMRRSPASFDRSAQTARLYWENCLLPILTFVNEL